MPNWCENNLTIKHKDKDKIQSILDTVNKCLNQKETEETTGVTNDYQGLLQSLIPMPKELEGTSSPHDSNNWYDWCINNWGCKWDIYEYWTHEPKLEYDGEFYFIELGFDTPWSPPDKAYEKLEKMGYHIYATFMEAGCDYVGRYTEGVDTTYSLDDVPKTDEELYEYVQNWRAED